MNSNHIDASNLKKYRAFTLIEMLLVMTITIALLGIGVSFFSGMRTTIVLNQTNETLKQNFRWTQRSAVLLKRDPGENWLYGIGIDMTKLYTHNTYRIFKWCSPYEEYGDNAKTEGRFPNFDDENDDISFKGNLPIDAGLPTYLPVGDNCSNVPLTAGSEGVFIELPNQGVGAVSSDSGGFEIRVSNPLRIGHQPGASIPYFVLYESGGGGVYMYGIDGKLLNYDNDGNYDNPADLEFVVVSPDGEKGTLYTLSYTSGRVTTDAVSKSKIDTFVFDPSLESGFAYDDDFELAAE